MMTSKIGSRAFGARSGFTLIEVLMAVSILAIGTVGVLRAYSSAITAMEIAQYNADALCLLEGTMGDVRETSIAQKGTKAGTSSGEFASSGAVKIDTTRSGKWLWDKEISDTGLKVEAPKEAASKTAEGEAASASATDGKTDSEEKGKEGPVYSLNKVKITVANPERLRPSRKVSLVTYTESEVAER